MSDERTLRLAYRPVSAVLLGQYVRFIEAELAGTSAANALLAIGLAAEDVARVTAAVNAFCRPRLLKRRLSGAAPKNPESLRLKQLELSKPVDDAEFRGLYGPQTHQVFLASEAVLVDLRARQVLTRAP